MRSNIVLRHARHVVTVLLVMMSMLLGTSNIASAQQPFDPAIAFGEAVEQLQAGIDSLQPPVNDTPPAPPAPEQGVADQAPASVGSVPLSGTTPPLTEAPSEESTPDSPLVMSNQGDSYSSMPGGDVSLPGLMDKSQYVRGTTGNPNVCFRLKQNDGRQVAHRLGITDENYRDASCASAEPKHIAEEPQTTAGVQTMQTDILDGKEDIVLLSVGGNPTFGKVVFDGLLFPKLFPQLFGGSLIKIGDPDWNEANEYYSQTVPAELSAAIAVIKQKSPHATVYVKGYPPLLDNHGANGLSCPHLGLSYTAEEVAPAQELLDTLNEGVERAANASGAEFVNLVTSADWSREGTGLCGSNTGFVDVRLSPDNLLLVDGSPYLDPLGAVLVGSFHPNAHGGLMTANAVFDKIQAVQGPSLHTRRR